VSDLLATYPDLGDAITRLCGGQTWRFTGASALLLDATHLYLEITKPKHWRRRTDDVQVADQATGLAGVASNAAKGHRPLAGIGAIGGSLEGDEGVLPCLRREVAEEVGAPITLRAATETHLVYEERDIETLTLAPGGMPAPVLCTVSRNLYRRRALPDARVLAIATFWATLEGPPRLGDLFGLLAVPLGALHEVLALPHPNTLGHHPTVERVRSLPGVRLETRRPMEGSTLLAPVWTARSLQILMHAGRLRLPLPGRVPPPLT
jgi:hypothetical protein